MEKKYTKTKSLCGPRYAIVRKEFLTVPIKKNTAEDTVFISLGGTLNYNIIKIIIDDLNLFSNLVQINVLTTSENAEYLKTYQRKVNILINLNADEIVKYIDNSFLCIITPGMILYEVLSRNKTAIVGYLNESQREAVNIFKKENFIYNLGNFQNMQPGKLYTTISRRDYLHIGILNTIFDGCSGKRILEAFKAL